jgi:hypothetical protein
MSGFPIGILELTSTGETVTITDPVGPVTNLESSGGGGGGSVDEVTSSNLTVTNPTGPTVDIEVPGSTYDAFGAAATAQGNAETFATGAANAAQSNAEAAIPALATTTQPLGPSAGGSASTTSKGDHIHATTQNYTDISGTGNQTPTPGSTVTVLTTPSLSVGVWEIHGQIQYGGGSTAGDNISVALVAGTSTVSAGLTGSVIHTSSGTAANVRQPIPFSAIVTVTTAGTVLVQINVQTGIGGTPTVYALDTTIVAGGASVTFVTCKKIG